MDKYWNTKAEDEKPEQQQQSEGPLMMMGGADDSRVSVENNKIYFYAGVTRQDNLMLNRLLYSTGNKMASIKDLYQLEAPPKVYLHINSYGGSVFAGFGSVDYIRNCAVPVVSVIDGCAASAATI